jgi:hypothetical protein
MNNLHFVEFWSVDFVFLVHQTLQLQQHANVFKSHICDPIDGQCMFKNGTNRKKKKKQVCS